MPHALELKGTHVSLKAAKGPGKVWYLHNDYADGQEETLTTTLDSLKRIVSMIEKFDQN